MKRPYKRKKELEEENHELKINFDMALESSRMWYELYQNSINKSEEKLPYPCNVFKQAADCVTIAQEIVKLKKENKQSKIDYSPDIYPYQYHLMEEYTLKIFNGASYRGDFTFKIYATQHSKDGKLIGLNIETDSVVFTRPKQ